MKKVLLVFGVFLFSGLSVFAYQYYGNTFKDDSKLADWAKDSVYKMKDAGVINGYSDDTFGPNNYVTRAELATMFDRYSDSIVNKNIYEFAYALNRMGYIDLGNAGTDDSALKGAILIAEAGFFMLDEAPEGYNNGKPDPELFIPCDIFNVDLPGGYSCYREVPYSFYLRYKGDRFVGQDIVSVDEWFGPFGLFDAAYKR